MIGADTNLYRSAANTLKTDDALIIDGKLTANKRFQLFGHIRDVDPANGGTGYNTQTVTLYQPTNYDVVSRILVVINSSQTLTVRSMPAGADGDVMLIHNVGFGSMVFNNEDTAGTAANRFICTGGTPLTLTRDQLALLYYDGNATYLRWRVSKLS